MQQNKYRQIISSVLDDIRLKRLKYGDPLPSINSVSSTNGVAKDTVVKAYSELIKKGLIESVPAKGFYVRSEKVQGFFRVFILFDTLNAYKEDLFNGLKDGFGKKAELDFYFHHFNTNVFADLIQHSKGKYNYYMVMPWPDKAVARVLSTMDQDKLMLLDRDLDFPKKKCSVLHQDFGNELSRVFAENWELLSKYDRLTLVFPSNRFHPPEISQSFKKLCERKKMKYAISDTLQPDAVTKGSVYLVLEDNDLVTIIECLREHGWQPGKEVGIVSYNEIALKKIVAGGITVVSTDFYNLGKKAAEIVLAGRTANEVFPSRLINRNTL